jgi:hypothetical protein
MRDLKLFTVKGERVVRLQMDAINCIQIPQDYLSFMWLGVPIHGRIWTFTEDNGIIIPQTLTNGTETLNNTKGEGYSRVEGKFNADGSRNGYSKGIYNTTGGKNSYYFKFDLENRRIILDTIVRTEVTLCYKSNGISASGQTLVPVIYEEAIMAFQKWHYNEGIKNMSWAQSGKNEYLEECAKLKFLESPSLEVLYDVIRSSWKMGVKR